MSTVVTLKDAVRLVPGRHRLSINAFSAAFAKPIGKRSTPLRKSAGRRQ